MDVEFDVFPTGEIYTVRDGRQEIVGSGTSPVEDLEAAFSLDRPKSA